MKDWLLAVGPLLGVLIGGLLSWLTSHLQTSRQHKQARDRLFLDKLEELHQLLTQFIDYYFALSFRVLREPGSLENIENPTIEHVSFDRIEVLVGFYAPELMNSVESIKQLTEEYSTPFAKWISIKQLAEGDKKNIKNVIYEKNQAIRNECKKLQKDIILVSRNLLSEGNFQTK